MRLPWAFSMIRAKSNTRYERRCSCPADKTAGVCCNQTVVLTGGEQEALSAAATSNQVLR